MRRPEEPASPGAPYASTTSGDHGHIRRAVHWARSLPGVVARARSRSRLLDRALRAAERDAEIGGGILAGALAYRLFLFALPLSFFLISTMSLLARAFRLDLDTAGQRFGFFGLVTAQVAGSGEASSSIWVAVSSLLILGFVTRALFRTVAIVHALAWRSPVGATKLRPGSMAVFAAAIGGQLALVVLVGAVHEWSAAAGVAVLGVFVLAVGALWLTVSTRLPHAARRRRDLVPGAVLYGVGVLGVQVFNAYLLGTLLESKASTYGSLGAAAAVLLGFFLIGRVMVGGAVLNATHPVLSPLGR